jgi:UDP-N-acetyl-D-glucosamine dehydrogenase
MRNSLNPLPSPISAAELAQKIKARKATIGVIGLGYVGLPLVLAFARQNFNLIGFDIDQTKVTALNEGKSYIQHIDAKPIQELVKKQQFTPTTDFSKAVDADVLIICVPTPLSKNRIPDMTYIEKTAETLKKHLRPGQFIVLESTVYPGTTTDVLKPILEESGLKDGSDFFLAFSPEREDPGNKDFETTTIPKVVGADSDDARLLVTTLYSEVVKTVVPVSSSATAEAVKLTENIFRSVNIALVNELKVIYGLMGIDIWEVVDAAKTKPFGYMPFYPGPGLGGHCIPIDPFYLTWKAREADIPTRFIELAGEVNSAMPMHTVRVMADAMNDNLGKPVKGSKILVIGVAYKKNIDDMRESPSLKIIELIEQKGAKVDFYDPHVQTIIPTREHPGLTGRKSIAWDAKTLQNYDAVMICTEHDVIDWDMLEQNSKLIIDTRNAMKNVARRDKIVKA